MKRIIKWLWTTAGLALLTFVLFVFFSKQDVVIWRAFSICMPLIGLCFWAAVILTLIDHNRSNKK